MAKKKKAKKAPQKAADGDVPFEKALGDLERIVERLEQGEVPLDESLKLYEQGVKAFRLCRRILDRAEKRIQVLVRDADGSLSVQDVDGESGDDADGSNDLFSTLDDSDEEA